MYTVLVIPRKSGAAPSLLTNCKNRRNVMPILIPCASRKQGPDGDSGNERLPLAFDSISSSTFGLSFCPEDSTAPIVISRLETTFWIRLLFSNRSSLASRHGASPRCVGHPNAARPDHRKHPANRTCSATLYKGYRRRRVWRPALPASPSDFRGHRHRNRNRP
jgi:hypothetical protein